MMDGSNHPHVADAHYFEGGKSKGKGENKGKGKGKNKGKLSRPSTTDTSGEMVETTKPHETTDEVASMLKQHEVVILGEQKRIAYCFNSPETDERETFIVIQVRHCRRGPPLLPKHNYDGSLSWVVSDDRFMDFATYLATTLEVLTNKSWSTRIFPNLRNVVLVRYQAAVNQEDWHEIFDTLLEPFGEQRMIYRKINKVKTAPDIFFGVRAIGIVR
jgi:hypothetical protein